MDHTFEARIFQALSEPIRLHILDRLSCGELCACEILEELSITQPTLSHHMKVLTDSGLVVARKAGTWVHYAIARDGVDRLRATLDSLLEPKDGDSLRTTGEKPCCA